MLFLTPLVKIRLKNIGYWLPRRVLVLCGQKRVSTQYKEKTYDFILWNSDVEADVLIDIIALPVGDCIVLGLVLCPAVLVRLGHVGTLGLRRVHWYTYVS